MIKILLLFFILLLGCSKKGISCSDIYLPDCDYKNTPKKCIELEKEECNKILDEM